MQTPVRILLTLALTVSTVVLGASAALADAPATWAPGEDQSKLHLLLIFAGGPVGLFLIIWIFGTLTARRNYVPPPPAHDVVPASHH